MEEEYKRYKGDNSAAFNNHFLEIKLEKNEDEPMPSKVEFVVGSIIKPYDNPDFPIFVDFDEKESTKLCHINRGYLRAYDDKGQRMTCQGEIKFRYEDGVVELC